MPRTPEQYEKLREEKREHIMDAALAVIAKEGFHNTSISKIAAEAQISKGLMYNYFNSKEELLIAIFDKGMNALADLFDPNKDGVLTEDEFDYFVDRTFDTLINNKSYWSLYFSVIMQPGIFQMIGDRYEKILSSSMKILIDYYERQGVEDPASEALIFGAAMDGISMNFILSPEMFPPEKVKKTIIDKFAHKKNN